MCLHCALPFHSINDNELSFILCDFNRLRNDVVMVILTQIKFINNPFGIENNILNTQHAAIFTPENIGTPTYLQLYNNYSKTRNLIGQ